MQPVRATTTEAPPRVQRSLGKERTKIGINGFGHIGKLKDQASQRKRQRLRRKPKRRCKRKQMDKGMGMYKTVETENYWSSYGGEKPEGEIVEAVEEKEAEKAAKAVEAAEAKKVGE